LKIEEEQGATGMQKNCDCRLSGMSHRANAGDRVFKANVLAYKLSCLIEE